MTDSPNSKSPVDRLDRPSEYGPVARRSNLPWVTEEERGALNLPKDGSQHRRYASLYEDLLN